MYSDKALPLTVEEISAEWLIEALDVPVKEFKITNAMHGTSSKIFIDLEFEGETDVPTRVCVKGGFSPAIREAFPDMWASYRPEVEFYNFIAFKTSMPLPRTWFCGTDAVSGQGLVIISPQPRGGARRWLSGCAIC